jgi:hypothetical protein
MDLERTSVGFLIRKILLSFVITIDIFSQLTAKYRIENSMLEITVRINTRLSKSLGRILVSHWSAGRTLDSYWPIAIQGELPVSLEIILQYVIFSCKHLFESHEL